jgi:cobalt/nickel transport system permease protein
MHIPDGFLSPLTYAPLYVGAVAAWSYGLQRLKRDLDQSTVPLLAVLTAVCFVFSMVAVPLPGGTTAHATGVALLALLFGIWPGFIAFSVVLFLQALVFGDGGITALPVNALAMGLAGGAAARLVFHLLRGVRESVALFVAGWLSVNLAALLVALVLGLQPLIAHDEAGNPLFFPFGLSITLPAVLLPHALIGLGEGVLTLVVYRFSRRYLPDLEKHPAQNEQ